MKRIVFDIIAFFVVAIVVLILFMMVIFEISDGDLVIKEKRKPLLEKVVIKMEKIVGATEKEKLKDITDEKRGEIKQEIESKAKNQIDKL